MKKLKNHLKKFLPVLCAALFFFAVPFSVSADVVQNYGSGSDNVFFFSSDNIADLLQSNEVIPQNQISVNYPSGTTSFMTWWQRSAPAGSKFYIPANGYTHLRLMFYINSKYVDMYNLTFNLAFGDASGKFYTIPSSSITQYGEGLKESWNTDANGNVTRSIFTLDYVIKNEGLPVDTFESFQVRSYLSSSGGSTHVLGWVGWVTEYFTLELVNENDLAKYPTFDDSGLNNYLDSEEALINSQQPGFDELNSLFTDTPNILSAFTEGLTAASHIISVYLNKIPLISSLLTFSLLLGAFSFVIGSGFMLARTYSDRQLQREARIEKERAKSYAAYKENRSRSESYAARYNKEKRGK